MRLIDIRDLDNLKLEQYQGEDLKERDYAILSHTWSSQEISFEEFASKDRPVDKAGYIKILKSCQVAGSRCNYLWADTCCIDKSSSAELSDAINSMFEWYRNSNICYAYLSDVSSAGEDWKAAFRKSKWWTRGWTLPELIAPSIVHFYSKEWEFLGSREELAEEIATITSIDHSLLCETGHSYRQNIHYKLQSISIARRMSWAAGRTTTRGEDIAYCLLGIFDINMPLLYGEGQQRAFSRLQEEIVKTCSDQSILAWSAWFCDSLFAPHPHAFDKTVDVSMSTPRLPMSLDARGLALDVDVWAHHDGYSIAILQGHLNGNPFCLPGIRIEPVPGLELVYRRLQHYRMFFLTWRDIDIPTNCSHYKLSIPEGADIQRQRIILEARRQPGDLKRHPISPPLTFSIEQDENVFSRYELRAAIPNMTSRTSITQSTQDILPCASNAVDEDGNCVFVCVCGVLYLEAFDGDGIFIFWGTRSRFTSTMLTPGWWKDRPPFVTIMCPSGDGIERLRVSSGRKLDEALRYAISGAVSSSATIHSVFGGLTERFAEVVAGRARANDPSSTTVAVSAAIEPVEFLDRTAFHLTLKLAAKYWDDQK